MKTFKSIRRSLLTAGAAAVALFSSCQSDPETVQASITVTPEVISISKLGIDYRGQVPSFEVVSNVYWTLTMVTTPEFNENDEEDEQWITVSQKGGSGTSTVTLKTLPNSLSEIRKAVITLTPQFGQPKVITLLQAADTEEIVYYTDDFGSAAANMTPLDEYTGWNYSGIGVDSPKGVQFSYSGTASVNSANASTGYPDASGGNNIVLSEAGSEVILNYVRPSGRTDLNLSFGSAATGAAFDSSELKVELSSDGIYWYDVPYTRGTEAEWDYSVFSLTLVESYTYLFIRFSTTAAEGVSYLIDDVSVKDGPGGQVFELVQPPFVAATFPVKWHMTAKQYEDGGVKGTWFETFSSANDSYYILSNTSKDDITPVGPSTLSFVYGEGNDWNSVAQVGTTGHPYVNYVWMNDYWLFSVPVTKLDAGMIVSVSFLSRSSGTGMKYFALEYLDGGQWLPASAMLSAVEDPAVQYTHIMGSSNVLVAEKIILANRIAGDYLQIRFRCAGPYNISGTLLASPSSGTHRIAADTGGDGIWPTIDIIDPNDKPETVTFELGGVSERNVITLPGRATSYSFTVKADWDWVLSTELLEWATVTPASGNMHETVTVTITTDAPNKERYGAIILTSGDTRVEITVFQSAAGGDGDVMKDDGKAIGYVYFEDNFDWIIPFGGPDDILNINTWIQENYPEGGYPTSNTYPIVTNTLNMYSADPEGYAKGDLNNAFIENGYTDILPSASIVYFAAHYLKFGKTNYQSGIQRTIPNTVEDKATNIRFTFDAAPVITGSGNYDKTFLVVEIEGPGSVGVNNGTTKTSSEIDIQQTNRTFPWAWQSEGVVLYGVTSETVVTLKTNKSGTDTGTFRYYLDNLKFEKFSIVTP